MVISRSVLYLNPSWLACYVPIPLPSKIWRCVIFLCYLIILAAPLDDHGPNASDTTTLLKRGFPIIDTHSIFPIMAVPGAPDHIEFPLFLSSVCTWLSIPSDSNISFVMVKGFLILVFCCMNYQQVTVHASAPCKFWHCFLSAHWVGRWWGINWEVAHWEMVGNKWCVYHTLLKLMITKLWLAVSPYYARSVMSIKNGLDIFSVVSSSRISSY